MLGVILNFDWTWTTGRQFLFLYGVRYIKPFCLLHGDLH